jgi:hypothetical protein
MLVTQSNTQQGALPFPCGEDLAGKSGYLVKGARNAGGKFAPILPTAIGDIPLFIVDEENTLGKDGTFIPLIPGEQRRIRLNGTCQAGDRLTLAAIAGTDAGKLRKQPTAAGTYHLVAIAEEDGVDEQLILTRIAAREAVVIP